MYISEEGNIAILGGKDSTVDYPGAPTYYYPFVLRSTDMGATCDTTILSKDLFINTPRLMKFNGNTGFIPLSVTKFFRTTDGGSTWDYLKITPAGQYQFAPIQDFTIIDERRLAFATEMNMVIWDEFNFTGLEDKIEKNSIAVFPQPASDIITFEEINEQGVISVDIIDSKGIPVKCLKKVIAENNRISLSLKGISNGTYIAVFKSRDGSFRSSKFIVNR
jgi:hypothetical protein